MNDAARHLASGRIAPAIEPLLVAWRVTRLPAIANRIERASRLLPAHDLPFAATEQAVRAAWAAAFRRDPAAALPQLLQNLRIGSDDVVESRFRRIARRLVEIWNLGLRVRRRSYWKALFALVVRAREVTTPPARLATMQGYWPKADGALREAADRLLEHPERAFDRWPLAPTRDEARELAAVDAQLERVEDVRFAEERQLITKLRGVARAHRPGARRADRTARRRIDVLIRTASCRSRPRAR